MTLDERTKLKAETSAQVLERFGYTGTPWTSSGVEVYWERPGSRSFWTGTWVPSIDDPNSDQDGETVDEIWDKDSFDDLLALMAAVLPGWEWYRTGFGSILLFNGDWHKPKDENSGFGSIKDNPQASLLEAITDAYSKEQST